MKLSKEFAELDPLVASIKSLQGEQHERDNLRLMIEDPASEPDMAELAREELVTVAPRVDQLEHDLQISFCRRMQRTKKARSLKFAQARAAKRRRFSPPIFSACISVMPT